MVVKHENMADLFLVGAMGLAIFLFPAVILAVWIVISNRKK